ncbi:MAG TPA: radical SAM protein [bacterium]|nr:radical SAM protein [bacterium]
MKPTLALLNPPAPLPTMRDYFCSSSSKMGYLWQPIDLLCQSGYLDADFTLAVLDAPAQELTETQTLTRLTALRPAVIIALVGTANYPDDFAFLERAAQATGARIFVSGDLARFYPQQVLTRFPFVEGVLLDFTGAALRDFLVDQIHDPALFLRGEIRRPWAQRHDSFAYPLPRHDLFRALPYRMPFLGLRFASLLTSLGCPFGCAYCNSSAIGFTERDRGNLFAELDALRDAGVRHLFVKDMTFNVTARRAILLLEQWRARGYDFRWLGYFRAETIDAELAALLKATGCTIAQIGLESASATALAEMRPTLDHRRAREGLAHLDRAGVCYGAHFIFGLPGDDEDGWRRTIELARSLKLRYASFNIFTPRPGSALAGESVDFKALRMDPSRTTEPSAAALAVRRANRAFYRRAAYWPGLLGCLLTTGGVRATFSLVRHWWRSRGK